MLILCAIISGFSTYGALTATPPFGDDPNIVLWLLNIDLIILMMLVTLIAWRLVGLWSGRKKGLVGSHLHVRLVYIFSMLAAVPVIIMTIFSAFFFHFGIQTWFSERVQTAVNGSQAVAQAYLEEHTQVIRADALAMANDLGRQSALLLVNKGTFEKLMHTQSMLRNLSEALVFTKSGEILARSGLTFSLEFESIPQYLMSRVEDGEVVVMTGDNDDRVRALLKLDNFTDSYLFVGRMVDPKVLSHLDSTKKAIEDYAALQAHYSGLRVTLTMIFVVVGFLMLLAAIWLGLVLARQLVTPISNLIVASDRVRAGDLSARVSEEETIEEFDYLGHSFNRMTEQIQEQQSDLLEANRQLDQRRRFTETVLSGVSSGVIGVDEKGMITLTNHSAAILLGKAKKTLVGQDITDVIPGIANIFKQAQSRPGKITQGEIPFTPEDGSKKDFLFKIAVEPVGEEDKSTVITFDDLSELQSAQRKAAWSDVARRIAHEIKNPLTPIQLSAERLRRKYMDEILSDKEIFAQCTDTIVKHVGDIERMVNEFSSFARMPEPVLSTEDLMKHVKEAVLFYKQANPNIDFGFSYDKEGSYKTSFDSRQIRQCLNNLIQNSIDSIHMRCENDVKNKKTPAKGMIDVFLTPYEFNEIAVAVSDNGIGFPKGEEIARLVDPYVTHKQKGTGLGLAIVKKIMEDHGGKLVLETPDWLEKSTARRNRSGATVVLLLPLEEKREDVVYPDKIAV